MVIANATVEITCPERAGNDIGCKQTIAACKAKCAHLVRSICTRRTLLSLFPLFDHLAPANYNWPRDFLYDFLAGLVICVMHIPMGMAYALLASLDPIYGLYASFFGPLVYAFLGSSKHVSMGTWSLASIMLYATADRILPSSEASRNATSLDAAAVFGASNSTWPPLAADDKQLERLIVVATITFCAGAFQTLFGCFRLGFITHFLSDSMIDGFTTAVAFHVVTSQLRYVLGLRKLPRATGFFLLPETYAIIFKNIHKVNGYEIAISSVAMFFLFFTRWLTGLACFRSRFKWPIPLELLLVIAATAISWAGDFKSNIGVNIVGHVPTGLPSPIMIDTKLLQEVAADAAIMAVVVFTVSFSMEKIMAKRHKYVVLPNQELVAFGVSNMVTACFRGFLGSVSLGRSLVQEIAGGRTQMTSIVSSGFMLLVLLVMGSWLRTLPKCILSSIVIVALYGMFKQALALPRLWRISRFDFSVWIVTFLATMVSNLAAGLGVGFSYSMLGLLLRSRHPQMTEMQLKLHNKRSEISEFVEPGQKGDAGPVCWHVLPPDVIVSERWLQAVRIVRLGCNATFLTAEAIAEHLRRLAEYLASVPSQEDAAFSLVRLCSWRSLATHRSASANGFATEHQDELVALRVSDKPRWQACIVVDLSCVALADAVGAGALVGAWKSLSASGVRVVFVGAGGSVKQTLLAALSGKSRGMRRDVVERLEVAVRVAVKSVVPPRLAAFVSSFSAS